MLLDFDGADDQAMDMLPEDDGRVLSDADSKPILNSDAELAEEIGNSVELTEETGHSGVGDTVSNTDQGTFSSQEPTLPILQKLMDLSNNIQNLKKEHTVLSDQVKDMKADSFLGPEGLDTLKNLNTQYELLKNKYLQEYSERKRLYNEVIELKGNIRVFCRCRPLNQVDVANGCSSVVELDSSQENELHIISSDSSKKQYKFDHVFGPEDSQEDVFAQTRPIVTSVLDGYNVCIFAYGQTGTGKTFTMEGTPENRGVNYRTLEELFRVSTERNNVMTYELYVSMLEVYNEKIRDLLVENSNQPSKRLEIKQAAEGTQEVPGLVEARVYGTEEVWELLKSGSRVRSVGSTNANELSSRSHCLLRVTVKGENLINGQKTKSHLWLVDLAGSERVGKIEVEGERLKESQFINKSLSALGDVISALASKTGHIPYRNSKLTHMLQSSLGGDCKTLMFVQISPSTSDLGETICSLNFASRVRGIESGPARKQADISELLKYKQMAEKMKHDDKETKKLQDTLQSMQLRLAAREHICRNLQEKVRDLENQLAEERKIRLKQETRAFASTHTSSLKQEAEKTRTERKPPLAPSKMRLPLRRITNTAPQPSAPTKKSAASKGFPAASTEINKENIPGTMNAAPNARALMQPRRISIAVRPPMPSTNSEVLKPRRRVSIATFQPEPSSQMTTPLHASSHIGRPPFVRDQRKARYSRLFSPMKNNNNNTSESTPTVMRSSSKFMGSPPGQQGSWRPKHPTVVALQRKSLVWSPLKLKGMKNYRKTSLLPTRPPPDML